MLDGDTIVFEYGQDFAAESDFGVHHIFFDVDGCKSFLSGNTGDRITRFSAGTFNDQRTRILRTVGIADVDRDTFLSYREDGFFMKHGSTHVCQLAKLYISDGIDHFRIFDDTWICDQETGYIGPVLIQISMDCFCDQRTCDIGSASGEGCYLSFCGCTIKSRNDCIVTFCQACRKLFIGCFCIKCAVFMENDHFSCIDKFISQVICHDDTV